jgi:putative aminopeptidase FrvX
MKASDFKILESLVNTPGLPGREGLISEKIQYFLPGEGWQINTDAVGNLTARKPGVGKRILFLTHMDEVGLIVRRVTPDGFLKVERLGGISLQALPGSAFDLWTAKGRLDAHAGLPAAHSVSGKENFIKLADIYLDIGAQNQAEVQTMGVRVGDGLTWASKLCRIGKSRIRSKALDNRTGCYTLVKLAHWLDEHALEQDITLAFITQEESMIMEAAPVIRALAPDVVIGVDGTLPFDTPDDSDPQCDIGLGGGPCIKIMDVIRGKIGYLPDWELTNQLIDFLIDKQFSYQPEVVVGISTAISLVPVLNHGVKTASFSLPIRYHHSPNEVVDLQDLDAMLTMLISVLENHVLG